MNPKKSRVPSHPSTKKAFRGTSKRDDHGKSKVKIDLKPKLNATRRDQSGRLPKLPAELQLMIFGHLGPASKRLLGSTCKDLYSIWKKEYFEKLIIIHMSELEFKGSVDYQCILGGWVPSVRVCMNVSLARESYSLYMKWLTKQKLRALEHAVSDAQWLARCRGHGSSTMRLKRHKSVIEIKGDMPWTGGPWRSYTELGVVEGLQWDEC
ncbi:uncharacterized protein PAC_14386 [Phialocephala subalpina]|uniref:F-box domain-containing protein n=1 Tax=Phialocephala subalpina TaxID=576137 RepID=A0A1L7XHK1_9HELO|nr:uncharacterized protein PAC_14386 [Phialocephala subalpina]